MKKYSFITAIILVLVLILAGCDGEKFPSQDISISHTDYSDNSFAEESSEAEPENLFTMVRYNWDGYGVGKKQIKSCDLGDSIIKGLSELKETGETVPKISDDIVDEYAGELPITRGTVWLECGSLGLFRLNPEMSEICRVDTHLGEGRVLEMTDSLKDLLGDAWFYYPYDCWSGKYQNGKVSVQQIYKSETAVESVEIESIYIENEYHAENNKITLSILANQSKTTNVILSSYQSADNLAAGDYREIVLLKGKETKTELTFGGFYDTTYWVEIKIDNTRIILTVNP